ncbi:MAG: nucleotidyltransferase family protein [Bacteroidales bacterium]|nr:nucleotidyltransferase family protein [Bacteroidales bacterium]
MDRVNKSALQLLQISLFDKEILWENLSDEEWHQLYTFVKEQGVTALCYNALKKLNKEQQPPRTLLLQWALHAERVEHVYQQQRNTLKEFYRILGVANAQALVIKGFAISRYYPVPALREFGDIDIYCFDSHDKINKYLQDSGIDVNYENKRHSIFTINGIAFENHSYFLYGKEPELENFLQSEAEKCRANSSDNILFGTEIGNAVFFLKHAEKHFVFSRVNIQLRTLCDWAVMLRSGAVDYNQLNAVKKGTTIDRFADICTCACVKLLGLSSEFLGNFPPVAPEILDNFVELITDYQHQLEGRGTLKGRVQRLFKYLKYYRTYKYIFGKNIIRWYYFE